MQVGAPIDSLFGAAAARAMLDADAGDAARPEQEILRIASRDAGRLVASGAADRSRAPGDRSMARTRAGCGRSHSCCSAVEHWLRRSPVSRRRRRCAMPPDAAAADLARHRVPRHDRAPDPAARCRPRGRDRRLCGGAAVRTGAPARSGERAGVTGRHDRSGCWPAVAIAWLRRVAPRCLGRSGTGRARAAREPQRRLHGTGAASRRPAATGALGPPPRRRRRGADPRACRPRRDRADRQGRVVARRGGTRRGRDDGARAGRLGAPRPPPSAHRRARAEPPAASTALHVAITVTPPAVHGLAAAPPD